MKQKDKQNFKNLSAVELNAELKTSREKQFDMIFKHSASPLKNPLQKRTNRRKIAMLKTFIREKERAEQSAAKS
ncbi:MAG: 50S ribosomal protein L29 [Elusimicrobia bacterium]|nr:50S ribosomal protein L29 [Elusimicrobiota bacterium]